MDNKTVTFDALIEFLKHTRSNHEKSIAARDPVIAAHIKDIGEWIDALAAAAPTPAAQSAGQEAVGQLQVSDNGETVQLISYVQGSLPDGPHDVYAAPVNGGEREWAIEEAAQIADTFKCGTCGMDGKCAAAIRELKGEREQQGRLSLREVVARKALALEGDHADMIGPATHVHNFELQPSSGIELCTYCGLSRVAARAADAQQVDANIRGEVAYQLHTRNRWLDMPTMRAIVDSAFDAAIAKNTLTSPAKVGAALLPKYTEWMHLRTHGQWSDGVPAWARDHSGRMNDLAAALAVISELYDALTSPAKEQK